MATLGNTPRPAYVYDTETDTWVPIGVGAHTHDTLYVNQNIIDAKGDLIVGTSDNSYDRLAAGNSGDTLVADSSTNTGLRWQGNFAAGKNKIINGDFGIWQRGTSFSSPAANSYLCDRFFISYDGSPTTSYSRQTFTPGTAPVAGYESSFFFRAAMTNASTTTSWNLYQKIEDVRTFAGQTVTVSFWAKADSTRSITFNFLQEFGSGGSGSVFGGAGQTNSVTTSWQRFSYTLTLPSMSGKTIGTGSSLTLYITLPHSSTTTVDIWGVQVEAGSVATAFQTATGTLAGELAACQRYFYKIGGDSNYNSYGLGAQQSGTVVSITIPFPVTMRGNPTLSGTAANTFSINGTAPTSYTADVSSTKNAMFNFGGSFSFGSNASVKVYDAGSNASNLTFSAEL